MNIQTVTWEEDGAEPSGDGRTAAAEEASVVPTSANKAPRLG